MMPNTLDAFAPLIGRRLDSVQALSPWSSSTHALAPSAAWIFHFEERALLCLSPLRLRSSQQGSTFGLDSGQMVPYGFRVHLADRESIRAMVINPGHWVASRDVV